MEIGKLLFDLSVHLISSWFNLDAFEVLNVPILNFFFSADESSKRLLEEISSSLNGAES